MKPLQKGTRHELPEPLAETTLDSPELVPAFMAIHGPEDLIIKAPKDPAKNSIDESRTGSHLDPDWCVARAWGSTVPTHRGKIQGHISPITGVPS